MTQATIETQAPFASQTQSFPGHGTRMTPKPDLGEATYKGSGRLAGKRAIVTGGDSGIGAAVAIAFAREVVVDAAVAELGGLDILVNNAAYQQATPNFEDITIEEWDKTFQTNINGLFYITKCAVPHMKAGCAIVNISSINAKKPMASLLPYSAIKAVIANFTLGLPQALAGKKIRVNAVLPSPIWTPFIPSGTAPEQVARFGSETPLGRPGQPAELAASYVMLVSDESSYTSGALVVVSGGIPIF